MSRARRLVLIFVAAAACVSTATQAIASHGLIRKEPNLAQDTPSAASLAQESSGFGSLLHTLAFNSAIEAVAFSPNGNEVATGSADNATTIWNAASGKALRTFYYHQGKVNFIAYSPDAEMILTGAKDGRAVIWNPKNRLVEREFAESGPIEAVAFSRSGMFVITGSDNKLAKIWDSRNSKLVCTLKGHQGIVEAVAMNPEGGTALTGSDDFTAKLWKVDDCIAAGQGSLDTAERTLVGHTGTVNAVAYSPFGRWVVTGSQDFTARIWEAKTGKSLRIFGGEDGGSHLGSVEAIAWKPPPKVPGPWKASDDQVLTGSHDGTAKLWMAHTGKLVHTFNHGGKVNSVSFAPDGSRILTGSSDGTAKVWKLSNYHASSTMDGKIIAPLKITRTGNHVEFDGGMTVAKVKQFAGNDKQFSQPNNIY